MAFTVTDSRTTFTANDSVGGWDESTTSYYIGADEGGREGSGFVGCDVDIETNHNWEVGITIPVDMTGQHYGGWLRVTNAGDLDTKALGGIRLALRDGSGNESYWYVGGSDTYSGGWAYFVCDLSGTPDSNNGTNAVVTNALDLGVGFKCLSKSLNDNCQMDLMHYGTGGVTITGTPDTGTYGTGKGWQEVHDIINTNNYGVMNQQAGSFVVRSPITLDTPTFNDADSIIFFADQPVSSTFYKIDLGTSTSNSIELNGFISKTEGLTAAELDFSAAVTSLVYDASTALNQGLTTFKSGDYSGDKFVQCAGIQANAGANLDAFVSDKSGLITLSTTATLTNSTISESTSSSSVICVDLARATGNSITSDGSNNAVELTSIGGGSMTWNNSTSNYDAGASGSPVTPTATGNEDLHVNVATGTLTVNVASGASIPSIRSAGATVNVVSGLSAIAFTLNPSITGYEWRIYTVTAIGSLAGAVEVAGEESAIADNQSYSYTHVLGIIYAVQFLPHAKIYEEEIIYFESSASDQSQTINLVEDINT